MQEHYLGDVHDFVKYAFLRSLAEQLDLRLGVNWYHTRTEPDSSDGDNRAYLSSCSGWESWEPDLFKRIEGLQQLSERRFGRVRELGILPTSTIYYEDQVPIPMHDRREWHESARNALRDSPMVFLDPDNGFEVKSMTALTRPKYTLFQEAIDFLRDDKVVITIQFAPRSEPVVSYARKRRSELREVSETKYCLPVIRGRAASPNILFFVLAPANRIPLLKEALGNFSKGSPRYEEGRRVELIE